jgi:hypothetical protein
MIGTSRNPQTFEELAGLLLDALGGVDTITALSTAVRMR